MSSLLLAIAWTTASAHDLTPRVPLPPVDIRVPAGQHDAQRPLRLGVKFVDDARVRATETGQPLVSGAAAPTDVDSLSGLLLAHQALLQPRLTLAPTRVDALLARAAERSGRAQPDLGGLHTVVPPGGTSADSLVALARTLQAHPLVEYAFVRRLAPPPPGDVAPTTPSYTDQQTYAGPDPGVDTDFARSLGATGARLALSDCEYGWEDKHEDLIDRDLHLESGQTVPYWVADYGYDMHGTAVVGVTSAVGNAYGITGTVVDAEVYTYPEYSDEEGSRRASAIASALADSDPGDVVMLEMQYGVVCDSCYGPAELDPDIWSLVRAGVDAGVVVVAAAGNGGQDLDTDWYRSNYLTWGDSGAIIVGAGSADTRHDALYFSTHGDRVDLQGWGERVFTLSYGDHAMHGGDPNQRYTANFAGTSSATPVVASAVVAVQDYVVAHAGEPLSPEDLRALLADTGIAQGSGDRVGPFPDVRAAIAELDADFDGAFNTARGGDDCDDADPSAYPGAEEVWYDGVDSDCAGDDDNDQDGDGFAAAEVGGDDCDDTDPDTNPTDTPEVTCASGGSGGVGGGGGGGGKATACATGAGAAWLGFVVVPLLAGRRRPISTS